MSLTTQLKHGNQPAFQKVYDQFHVKLYHFFLRNVRVQESAKELTQLAFIKLWQSRHTLSESCMLDAQLFTIANSIFIDHLRKSAVQRKHLRVVQAASEQDPHIELNAAVNYESADYLNVLSASLPPGRKKVLRLKIIKGYSNKEIAEELSVSVKTVEDHYSKALKQLRSVMTALLFCISQFFPY